MRNVGLIKKIDKLEAMLNPRLVRVAVIYGPDMGEVIDAEYLLVINATDERKPLKSK